MNGIDEKKLRGIRDNERPDGPAKQAIDEAVRKYWGTRNECYSAIISAWIGFLHRETKIPEAEIAKWAKLNLDSTARRSLTKGKPA